MSDKITPGLSGKRLLVAEDDYMIAGELADALRDLGAEIVGPAQSLERALALAQDVSELDGAILDINLRNEHVYPVVDLLQPRGIPVVFATGYDQSAIPHRYAAIPRLQKPVQPHHLAVLLTRGVT
jgi:CheY-like chemotaxis protein